MDREQETQRLAAHLNHSGCTDHTVYQEALTNLYEADGTGILPKGEPYRVLNDLHRWGFAVKVAIPIVREGSYRGNVVTFYRPRKHPFYSTQAINEQ